MQLSHVLILLQNICLLCKLFCYCMYATRYFEHEWKQQNTQINCIVTSWTRTNALFAWQDQIISYTHFQIVINSVAMGYLRR